jgi:hypothetical protein
MVDVTADPLPQAAINGAARSFCRLQATRDWLAAHQSRADWRAEPDEDGSITIVPAGASMVACSLSWNEAGYYLLICNPARMRELGPAKFLHDALASIPTACAL